MTIEELNKIIQEELKAYLNEEQTDEAYMEDEDGDDDIEVTTDEPDEEDDPLATLRQIYDMLKPLVEPEGEVENDEGDVEGDEEEVEGDEGDDEEGEEVDEAVGYPNYRADQVQKVKHDAGDINQSLNESVARFKKLANIKG